MIVTVQLDEDDDAYSFKEALACEPGTIFSYIDDDMYCSNNISYAVVIGKMMANLSTCEIIYSSVHLFKKLPKGTRITLEQE